MNAPWHDPASAAWRVYADFLADQNPQSDFRLEKEWLRALRFAEGLRRRPRMVLTGRGERLADNDHQRRTILRGAKNWAEFGNPSWVTVAWVARVLPADDSNYGKFGVEATERVYAATPADFHGMTDDLATYGGIVREFYRAASYDVWLMMKGQDVMIRGKDRKFVKYL